jgi:lipopolysaccharide/colanic/teichoic acid biosynthesis glycosyltransferase
MPSGNLLPAASDSLFRSSNRRVAARPSWRAAAQPFWKRALDIGLGTLLSACALPLIVIAATAIKCSDGGPILFWQRRVGQGGRLFWFPKLRSMHVGAHNLHHSLRRQNDHGDSVTFKMRADPRVTRIGRLLRTLSIDELPQLWCVLKGDMSLVGPRPPLPSEAMRYTPAQRRRLEAKPGMTGLWQVCGRSTIPFEGQVTLDLEYIDRHSLWLDLDILRRTVRAVVSCKGAW